MYFTNIDKDLIEEIFPYPEFPIMHAYNLNGNQGYMIFKDYAMHKKFMEALSSNTDKEFISKHLK